MTVEVTNTGTRYGEEVVQLYFRYHDSRVERPQKGIKGFTRVKLQPGETRPAIFTIPAQQLAYYDEIKSGWVVEPTT